MREIKTVDHATAARQIAHLLAEVDKSGEPVKIVDPGRHAAVLVSEQTWAAICVALEIKNGI